MDERRGETVVTKEYWATRLAIVLARQRTQGIVSMDGLHRASPSERIAARAFIEEMVAEGWLPPASPAQRSEEMATVIDAVVALERPQESDGVADRAEQALPPPARKSDPRFIGYIERGQKR